MRCITVKATAILPGDEINVAGRRELVTVQSVKVDEHFVTLQLHRTPAGNKRTPVLLRVEQDVPVVRDTEV